MRQITHPIVIPVTQSFTIMSDYQLPSDYELQEDDLFTLFSYLVELYWSFYTYSTTLTLADKRPSHATLTGKRDAEFFNHAIKNINTLIPKLSQLIRATCVSNDMLQKLTQELSTFVETLQKTRIRVLAESDDYLFILRVTENGYEYYQTWETQMLNIDFRPCYKIITTHGNHNVPLWWIIHEYTKNSFLSAEMQAQFPLTPLVTPALDIDRKADDTFVQQIVRSGSPLHHAVKLASVDAKDDKENVEATAKIPKYDG